MAERLPGIFGHIRSVWCQEVHPPSGTVCRLHRKRWVADVSKCHSVLYKMVKALELSVGSRSQAVHLLDWYKVCPAGGVELMEQVSWQPVALHFRAAGLMTLKTTRAP